MPCDCDSVREAETSGSWSSLASQLAYSVLFHINKTAKKQDGWHLRNDTGG